jgi:hypothetical protein
MPSIAVASPNPKGDLSRAIGSEPPSRFTAFLLPVAIGILVLGMIATPSTARAGSESPSRATRAETNLTPVTDSVLSTPRWYKGDDGRFHLDYELKLTNAVEKPVDVRSVQVLGPAGRRIATLSGGRLKAAMTLLASPDEPTATLPPSTVGIVWFDLSFSTRGRIPKRVKHRLTVDIGPGLPHLGPLITDAGARATVARRGPMVLAPPLAGGRWATVVGVHRRALLPVNGHLRLGQRFAADFSALLDGRRRTHHGDPNLNSSYFDYGQPVLAVGPGRIVAAVDRLPNQIPNHAEPTGLSEADGNHVIIRLRKGVFAAYGHLKPGSVRVHRGQLVHAGQVLGSLGNSGNSTGPHLHFQLMDRPSFVDAEGLPFVLGRFRFDGRIPSLEALVDADADPAAPPVPFRRSKVGGRRQQGFTGLEVVSFPGG